eukprot:TRINITY_DN1529_c7_g1_i1.p1 TRINITY_DN1529_c7_g1~~TRINITY_DN1529_c7_g1_i1.p1  ORF type:complete len:2595 (+),score=778.51 TRINITY_DN1529_c7_g1_i1:55-7785(+)
MARGTSQVRRHQSSAKDSSSSDDSPGSGGGRKGRKRGGGRNTSRSKSRSTRSSHGRPSRMSRRSDRTTSGYSGSQLSGESGSGEEWETSDFMSDTDSGGLLQRYTELCVEASMSPNASICGALANVDKLTSQFPPKPGVLDFSLVHLGVRHVRNLATCLHEHGCPVARLSFAHSNLPSTLISEVVRAVSVRGTAVKELDVSHNPGLAHLAGRELLRFVRRCPGAVICNVEGTAIHESLARRIQEQCELNAQRQSRQIGGARASAFQWQSVDTDELLAPFKIPRTFLGVYSPPVLVSVSAADMPYARQMVAALGDADPRLSGAFALFEYRRTSRDYQHFIRSCFIDASMVLVVATRNWALDTQCKCEAVWFAGRPMLCVLPSLEAFPAEAGPFEEEAGSSDESQQGRSTQGGEGAKPLLQQLLALSTAVAPLPHPSDPRTMLVRVVKDKQKMQMLPTLPAALSHIPPRSRFHLPLDSSPQSATAAGVVAAHLCRELGTGQTFALPPAGELRLRSSWQKLFIVVTQHLRQDNPQHVALYPRLVKRIATHRKDHPGEPYVPQSRTPAALEKVIDEAIRKQGKQWSFVVATATRKRAPGAKKSQKGKAGVATLGADLKSGQDRAKSPSASQPSGHGVRFGSESKGADDDDDKAKLAGRPVFFDVDSQQRFILKRGWRLERKEEEVPLALRGGYHIPHPLRLQLQRTLTDAERRVARERASLLRERRTLACKEREMSNKVSLIGRLRIRADAERLEAGAPLAGVLRHIDTAIVRSIRSLKEPRLTDAARSCVRAVLIALGFHFHLLSEENDGGHNLEWWWQEGQKAMAAEAQFLYQMANLRPVGIRKRQWRELRVFLADPVFSQDSADISHERWAVEAISGARPRGDIALFGRWVHCVCHEWMAHKRFVVDVDERIDDLQDEYEALEQQVEQQRGRVELLQGGVSHLSQHIGELLLQYEQAIRGGDAEAVDDLDEDDDEETTAERQQAKQAQVAGVEAPEKAARGEGGFQFPGFQFGFQSRGPALNLSPAVRLRLVRKCPVLRGIPLSAAKALASAAALIRLDKGAEADLSEGKLVIVAAGSFAAVPQSWEAERGLSVFTGLRLDSRQESLASAAYGAAADHGAVAAADGEGLKPAPPGGAAPLRPSLRAVAHLATNFAARPSKARGSVQSVKSAVTSRSKGAQSKAESQGAQSDIVVAGAVAMFRPGHWFNDSLFVAVLGTGGTAKASGLGAKLSMFPNRFSAMATQLRVSRVMMSPGSGPSLGGPSGPAFRPRMSSLAPTRPGKDKDKVLSLPGSPDDGVRSEDQSPAISFSKKATFADDVPGSPEAPRTLDPVKVPDLSRSPVEHPGRPVLVGDGPGERTRRQSRHVSVIEEPGARTGSGDRLLDSPLDGPVGLGFQAATVAVDDIAGEVPDTMDLTAPSEAGRGEDDTVLRCVSAGGAGSKPAVVLALAAAAVPVQLRETVATVVSMNMTQHRATARRRQALQRLPLLRGLGEEVLGAFARGAEDADFASRATVILAGDASDSLLLLTEGTVRIMQDEATQEVTAGRGCFFPTPEEVLQSEPFRRTVVAGPDGCKCVRIRRDALESMQATFSAIRQRLRLGPRAIVQDGRRDQVKFIAHGLKVPWPDYNEEFQKLVAQRPTNIREARRRRAQLERLRAAFLRAAEPLAEMAVSELHGDPKARLLPAVSGACNHPHAGGQRYLVNGLLLEVASNKGNAYGGTAGAQKAAKHELVAWGAVLGTRCGLSVPLAALVTHRGFRVRVTALLPIGGRSTVVYGGSGGPDVPVRNGDAEAAAAAKAACAALNLKGHRTPGSQRLFYGPADSEVRRGTDGRLYLLRPGRLFPSEKCDVEDHEHGQWLVRLLRPELVAAAPEPLSSDAYSSWGGPAALTDDDAAAKAAHRLSAEMLPKLTKHVAEHFEGKTSLPDGFDGTLDGLTGESHKLCRAVHSFGVNLRRLAALVVLLPLDADGAVRRVHTELIARAFRSVLSKNLRGLASPTGEACEREAARLLSLLMGKGVPNTELWRDSLYPEARRKFGFTRLASFFEGLPTLLISSAGVARVEYSGFTAGLEAVKEDPTDHILLLARVCELTGIHLHRDSVRAHYERLMSKTEDFARSGGSGLTALTTGGGGPKRTKRRGKGPAGIETVNTDSVPFHFVDGLRPVVCPLSLPPDDDVMLFCAKGRLDLAAVELKRRIDSLETTFGAGHASIVGPLRQLAALHASWGTDEKIAEEGVHLRRALNILTADLPFADDLGRERAHSLDEAALTCEVARHLLRTGDAARASHYARIALHLVEALGLADTHTLCTDCLLLCGEADEMQLQHGGAREAYGRVAAAAAEQGLPPDHPTAALAAVGVAVAELGDFMFDQCEERLDSMIAVLKRSAMVPTKGDAETAQHDKPGPAEMLARALLARHRVHEMKDESVGGIGVLRDAVHACWHWSTQARGQSMQRCVRTLVIATSALHSLLRDNRQTARADALLQSVVTRLPLATRLLAEQGLSAHPIVAAALPEGWAERKGEEEALLSALQLQQAQQQQQAPSMQQLYAAAQLLEMYRHQSRFVELEKLLHQLQKAAFA